MTAWGDVWCLTELIFLHPAISVAVAWEWGAGKDRISQLRPLLRQVKWDPWEQAAIIRGNLYSPVNC